MLVNRSVVIISRMHCETRTLDEALCIILRLEAWAKSVNREKQEDDRIDRPRQKARATAKHEPNQQRQALLCWDCNLPGHITRDYPMRNRPMYGPRSGNDAANRGLFGNPEILPYPLSFELISPIVMPAHCDVIRTSKGANLSNNLQPPRNTAR